MVAVILSMFKEKKQGERVMITYYMGYKDCSDLKRQVPDLKVQGSPDEWKLLYKFSSKNKGFMEEGRVLNIGSDCLLKIVRSTRNKNGVCTDTISTTLLFDRNIKNGKIVGTETEGLMIDIEPDIKVEKRVIEETPKKKTITKKEDKD